MFQSPRYLINDWDLAKQILIKDFEYFTDRPAFPDADPITTNFMTNLSGKCCLSIFNYQSIFLFIYLSIFLSYLFLYIYLGAEWKKMRMLMSGVFTREPDPSNKKK